MTRFSDQLGTGVNALIGLAFCLAAAAAPRARLIYATSKLRRLDTFLAMARRVADDDIGAIAAEFHARRGAAGRFGSSPRATEERQGLHGR